MFGSLYANKVVELLERSSAQDVVAYGALMERLEAAKKEGGCGYAKRQEELLAWVVEWVKLESAALLEAGEALNREELMQEVYVWSEEVGDVLKALNLGMF